MNTHTHFVLTCERHHTWFEPIPAKKVAAGEHRLCPKCGCNSWIAPDATIVTLPAHLKGKRADTGVEAEAMSHIGSFPVPPIKVKAKEPK